MSIQDIDIVLFESELPNGYSGGVVYEDDYIYVSFCRGNSYNASLMQHDDRRVVLFTFKKLGLRIKSGESTHLLLKNYEHKDWKNVMLDHLFQHYSGDKSCLLHVMVDNAIEVGRAAGKLEAQIAMRNALGLEDAPFYVNNLLPL